MHVQPTDHINPYLLPPGDAQPIDQICSCWVGLGAHPVLRSRASTSPACAGSTALHPLCCRPRPSTQRYRPCLISGATVALHTANRRRRPSVVTAAALYPSVTDVLHLHGGCAPFLHDGRPTTLVHPLQPRRLPSPNRAAALGQYVSYFGLSTGQYVWPQYLICLVLFFLRILHGYVLEEYPVRIHIGYVSAR
jgi:hypothetical protein